MNNKNISLLLADDHFAVRQVICRLLRGEDDITVLAEVSDGRQAVSEALRLKPDVVIMDISMPLMNGLEATRRIVKEDPEIKVLILSANGNESYVAGALEAGASAFVLKQTCGDTLGKAVRAAMDGESFFCSGIKHSPSEQRLQIV